MAPRLHILLGFMLPLVTAQRQTLTVAASGGNQSSPLLFGSLYEDIYHSGDGGLYAELIRNRAFQGSSQSEQASLDRTTDFWHPLGPVTLSVEQSDPVLSSELPWSMRVDIPAGTEGPVGFYNDGFWGFHVDASKRYAASLNIRGAYNGEASAALYSIVSGQQLSSTNTSFTSTEDAWTAVQFPVFQPTTSADNPNNTFHFIFDGAQLAGRSIHVNLLSLFKQTYKDRDNGMREDLAISFENLETTWIRLPGGNNMEGLGFPNYWKWNETIGSLTTRDGHLGVWGDINTDGFGLLEMMQWCTDMNQTVFLGIFAGLFLNGDLISEADFPPYVDMAMEQLEFLKGDTSTKFGALRQELGYPQPFDINHVEIGNEDYLVGGNESYINYRFSAMYNRIHAKYPDMNIISSIIPAPVQEPGTWVDLHVYRNQDYFATMYDAFDHTDRNYPVIVGEYAAIYEFNNSEPQIGAQTMGMALAEGIMLLGAERNSDVIKGTAYGALIKQYNEEPGTVAVIKHTANQILQSTSYYVQKVFSAYHGDATVGVTTEFGEGIGPVYWSATKVDNGSRILKLLNYYGSGSVVDVVFDGDHEGTAEVVTLTAPGCSSINNLPQLGGESTSITKSTIAESDGRFTVAFDADCEIKILIA